jgi:hypothetical protein
MTRAYATVRAAAASSAREPSRAPVTAGLHSTGRTHGNQARQRLLAAGVQAKLSVSEPGDSLEREADRVADQVMRMPNSAPAARIGHQAGGAVQRKCAACESAARAGKPKCAACEAEDGRIQRKPAGATAPPATSAAVPAPGTGAPLAADVRAFFEPRFDRDFGAVRIHTGAHAAASAHSLNALAYTRGRDIVFGESQYAPGTSAGRRLLAHELAHVVQQSDDTEARQRIHRQPQEEEEELPDAPPVIEPLPPIEPPGPEPEFECKFDIFKLEAECCAPVPGIGRVCAPDPVTLMKKIEEALAKMGKKKPRRIPKGIEFCPPNRQIPRDAPPPFRAGGCCSEGTFWNGFRCSPVPVTPSCTPEKCKEGEIFIGPPLCCIPRGKKEEPPPPPPPRKEQVIGSHEVFFQFDRPAGETTGSAEFDRAITGDGKSNFEMLVEQLKADPDLKVQLVGAASTEGPEDYNFDLAKRRAMAVADALEHAGIDRSRIADPTEDDLRSECKPIGTGLRSCGELGAAARDRRVLARVFGLR